MRSVMLPIAGAAVSALVSAGCFLIQPGNAGPSSGPGPSDPAGPNQPGGSEPAASPSRPAEPSGPKVVSVSIKNNCRETVKVFYGKEPKFGSGTHSSIGGNTRTSKQMKAGEMIWLVDDRGEGIGSVSVSEGTRNVEILESCTGMAGR